ncbi:MAG TPA: oligosaccharide flippase family protein [Planctomycetota bacterium]|nr:oligosaccharide flippase family protein [Planctomycetota bacterium]
MKTKVARPRASRDPRGTTTQEHLRSSNLLLVGRLVALLVNFLVQVVTVRYLAKRDFGAFAYAVAIVSTVTNAILLGVAGAVSRYAPLYEERRDYASMYGTLFLATGSVVALGTAVVATILGLSGLLIEPHVADPLAASLLVVLIALAPLQALDSLFEDMLAVFSTPWALFVRRFVVGPSLKLLAVLGIVLAGGDVRMLAVAYLVAGVVSVAIYLPLLRRAFARRGLLAHLDLRRLRFPVREVYSFGLPVFVSDVMNVLRTTLPMIVLEAVSGSTDVADFRALVPVAGLNLIVMQSMKMLYVPVASRLYARGDHAGIDDLFWQTAVWIAVVTFPVVAVCIALAEPVTVLLFGERYAGAGPVLAVLAAGNYLNAAMGLNGFTLQVYGCVRILAAASAVATGCGFALSLALVRGHGALGAAAAVLGAHAIQNFLYHLGLHLRTQVELVRWRYLRVYATVAVALLLLLGVDWLEPPVALEAVLVAAAFLGILRMHRRIMDVGNVFPALGRIPWMRHIVGVKEEA